MPFASPSAPGHVERRRPGVDHGRRDDAERVAAVTARHARLGRGRAEVLRPDRRAGRFVERVDVVAGRDGDEDAGASRATVEVKRDPHHRARVGRGEGRIERHFRRRGLAQGRLQEVAVAARVIVAFEHRHARARRATAAAVPGASGRGRCRRSAAARPPVGRRSRRRSRPRSRPCLRCRRGRCLQRRRPRRERNAAQDAQARPTTSEASNNQSRMGDCLICCRRRNEELGATNRFYARHVHPCSPRRADVVAISRSTRARYVPQLNC